MAQLAETTKKMGYRLEQVQDFTPTPMTVSTETWYTGYDPYTLEHVFSARTPQEKLAQRKYFFWYKEDETPPTKTVRNAGQGGDRNKKKSYNPNFNNKKRNGRR